MTLEQIRNNQENIVNSLIGLLDEQRTVVNRITGSSFTPKEKEQKPIGGGLINEIDCLQKEASDLISELNQINITLISNTYTPNEPIKN